MINQGLLVGGVGEIRLLCNLLARTSRMLMLAPYLSIPEMGSKVVAPLSQLESNNLMHDYSSGRAFDLHKYL